MKILGTLEPQAKKLEGKDLNILKTDLMKAYEQIKLNNPVTDIVDSYYIVKAGHKNNEIR